MSSNENGSSNDFESVKNRLAEIADAVDDESLSFDEVLDLYEEAVALGLQASDLLESGIVVPDEATEEAAAEGAAAEEETADAAAARADVQDAGESDAAANASDQA